MATHTLHIGINYEPDENRLAGCVNDARDMVRLFGQRRRGAVRDAIDTCRFFGKADSQVLVIDPQATRKRILAEITALMKKLRPGDWGVITFSGHGTYVRDRDGDELDGFDEALVGWDYALVVDDEFGGHLERREQKSKLLVITDACHSGTGTRSMGPRLLGPTSDGPVRFLPPNRLPKQAVSGWSLKARRPSKLFNVIHLAACLDSQFAADARFGGRPRGAFTHYLVDALCSLRPGATFADWCRAIGQRLPNDEYDQKPQANAYARCLSWKIPTL